MEDSNSVVHELTDEEMKKKNTGIVMKELKLECDFGSRIANYLSFFRVKDVSTKTVQKGLL